MSEVRQNLATREWVVISSTRSQKPKSIHAHIDKIRASDKSYDGSCPFCPGNEKELPVEEKFRIDGAQGDWKLRVIDNKYKIFDSNLCAITPEPFLNEGIYKKLKACGEHELIIETPQHNKIIADMSEAEVKNIIVAFMQRYRMFAANPGNLITLIFKNYGAMAGQTQIHSHTQIVNSRIVPSYIRLLLNQAQEYFDDNGTCVFCDMISYELKDGKRLICENEDYVAFVPYAAGTEHETWIMPKYHGAGLDSLKEEKVDRLANILRTVFGRFYAAIQDPDFNFVIRNAPYPLEGVPFYHWHIQLLPRTKIVGGFEWGTRIPVNTIHPEESAKLLREYKV